MSAFEDRLNEAYAPAWRPAAGDTLVGTVVALGERQGEFEPYPIITVETDGGQQFAFHAFHTVAKSELAAQKPRIGERVGVKYIGQIASQGGRGKYHGYRIIVDRPMTLDWSTYGDEDAPMVDYSRSDVPSDVPAPARARQALEDELDELPY
jgi:hypothetical protein